MHLLLLGAGETGCAFARAIRCFSSITRVTIGDLSYDAAMRAAAICHGHGVRIDVDDGAALSNLLHRHDIIVSTIGPASRFAVPLLRRVIASGCHYVDVADDPWPTLEMLQLDHAARAAGVIAAIGCGTSPGISNLLAVAAADRLDHVDRLLTLWGSAGDESEKISGDGEGISAALRHWVEQVSAPVPVWRGGKAMLADPLERITVHYPGIGLVRTRLVGHPEAVTLPAKYPSLQECLNLMDFSRYVIAMLARASHDVRLDLLTIDCAAVELARSLGECPGRLRLRDILAYAGHGLIDRLSLRKWLPPLCAVAEGTKGGRRTTIAAALNGVLPGGTGYLTALPAAIITDRIASGSLNAPGTFPPELLLAPDTFFAALRPFLIDTRGKSLASDLPTVDFRVMHPTRHG